jgi:Ca2+-binding RTX toxin-like protein
MGGDGNDTFVIDATDRLVAIIGDFHHGEDLIGLGASYAGLFSGGTLQDGVFTIGAAATETGHRLIYNPSNGSLYYDGDGSGAGAAVEVANFSPGLALTTSDFLAMID